MKISELARLGGVSVHALRHYEALGLLKPARLANGYRDYPPQARREVVFIRMARQIGIALPQIAQMLPAYRSGRMTHQQLIESLRERVAEIDSQISQLRAQRPAVVDHIAWARRQAASRKERR